MSRFCLFTFLVVFSGLNGFSQNEAIGDNKKPPISLNKPKSIRCYATVVKGDTLPMIYLKPALIIEKRKFKNSYQSYRYARLVRNVKKAYPYAKIAGIKLKQYNKLLKGKSEEEKKRLMKKAESELKKDFEKDIQNLTFTQGKILLKLIDRETGNTSYEIVKQLRGSISAAFWQSLATVFGSNLKSEYDGEGEDREVEEIVLLIERGEI